MIGQWTQCVAGQSVPAEGELVVFVRSATRADVAVPLPPFEDLLGERAEIVAAVFVAGAFVQQNGFVQPVDADLWWTSLPRPPGPAARSSTVPAGT